MPDLLPPIHIVIADSPSLVLKELAAVARQIDSYKVEFVERSSVAPGLSAVNIKYKGVTGHEDLGVQFLAFDDEPGRLSVEVRASSLTVLMKSRHYANFFKQEVNLDGRASRVRAVHGALE